MTSFRHTQLVRLSVWPVLHLQSTLYTSSTETGKPFYHTTDKSVLHVRQTQADQVN